MYIGIDLGGTNIAVGLINDSGKILSKNSLPTIKNRDYTEIVKDMATLCNNVTQNAGYTMNDINSIGIGVPGCVDNKNGKVIYLNNIPMENKPIVSEFQKYYNIPIKLENDANAAAYGEYVINGGGVSSFVFVTLGTGVGGGIILNGEIYNGFNGTGGELGHVTLVHNGEPCTCGKNGCWEAYASVTALIRQTSDAIKKNPQSIMSELSLKKGVTGFTAFDAAKKGDSVAKKVVEQYIKYVADGITSIINIFQPEKLVIGGGISREQDYLLNPIIDFANKYGYNKYLNKTKIEIATLFNDAGIIGAGLLAKQK